jgi:transcription elongation factor Elf1
MDSPDWLRTQLTTFTCPACGRRYRGSKMRLLAEREGLFFVDLDCSRCGSHTVAIVTVELDDSEATIEVSDVIGEDDIEHLGEPLPVGTAPVTADDVLEMHQFLTSYRGNLGELVETGPTGSGGPRTDGAKRR